MNEQPRTEQDRTGGVGLHRLAGQGVICAGVWEENAGTLMLIRKGKADVRVGVKCGVCCAGDVLYIPAGLVYQVTSEDTALISCLTFYIDQFAKDMDPLDRELLQLYCSQARARGVRYHEGHPVRERLAQLISECEEEHSACEPGWTLAVRGCMFRILTCMLRTYGEQKKENERQVYHNVDRLTEVLDMMHADFREHVPVGAFADRTGLSADYFTRVFKESVGETPVEYVNGIRINHAMKLLCGDRDIRQIAAECGFGSAGYFSEVFRAMTGTSPAAYRRSLHAGL